MSEFEFEGQKYLVANPYDGASESCGRPRYLHAVLFTVGICASDHIIVFTDKSCDMCDLDSALESALDALPDKDWDCSDQVNEAYEEAIAMGDTEEEAWDASMEDVTPINGGSHYIVDLEWGCGGITKELEAAARQHCKEDVDDMCDLLNG
jgi:hypothetical protein